MKKSFVACSILSYLSIRGVAAGGVKVSISASFFDIQYYQKVPICHFFMLFCFST